MSQNMFCWMSIIQCLLHSLFYRSNFWGRNTREDNTYDQW